MSDLHELYQQLIIDHGRHPRRSGSLDNADCIKEGYNPLCGDKLSLYIKLEGSKLDQIRFEASGCAISVASASLMAEHLEGKDKAEAKKYFELFHELVTRRDESEAPDSLGKLAVLRGVAQYPSRVKCATLCWHTLKAALEQDNSSVSTE